MLRDYRVFVQDADLSLVGQVDVASELDFTLAFNGAGSWTLTLPYGHSQTELLAAGRRIAVYLPGATEPLFSGPVRSIGVSAQDKGQAPVFTAGGIDDNARAWYRVCYPTPSSTATNQVVDANYIATGPAETILKAIVDGNAATGALPERRIPGLQTAPDLARGSTVHVSLRFEVMGDVLVANAGGLGWRIAQSGAALLFDVYEPRDLSDSVRFSREIGNLETYEWQVNAAQVTDAIVAGQGVGVARSFVERTAAADDFAERIETFVDRRDTNDSPTLDQAGDDALSQGGTQTSATIGPVDTTSTRFGRDYFLGDLVTVDVDGVSLVDVVRQVTVNVTADEVKATPVIGGVNATDDTTDPLLVRFVAQLAQDVRALKARQ